MSKLHKCESLDLVDMSNATFRYLDDKRKLNIDYPEFE